MKTFGKGSIGDRHRLCIRNRQPIRRDLLPAVSYK